MKFKNQKMNIERKRRVPIKLNTKNQQVVEMSDRQQTPNDQYHSLRQIWTKQTSYEWRHRIQKRGWSKNFESKRGRSGIIGRILQPKGYSYCHTIYHTDTVTESSSKRLTPHLPRHCRPRATEYITVRLLYIYHHILSTDNKEILLPPTVSIISRLAP